MTSQAERDAKAYALAKKYLLGLTADGVTPELLERYLCPTRAQLRPQSIRDIYFRILLSAQNAGMKSGVIGKSIGGVESLGRVLCEFEPSAVLTKYSHGWEQVLDDIQTTLAPRGQVRRESRSIWPRYCRTVLSAAEFMARFSTAEEFFEWVDFFDRDERARLALPMLLDWEIEGLGLALACDFLKEMGFVNFAKPDVHIRDIFTGLALCSTSADDYGLLKAVARVAGHAGVTVYNADKLFWLVGSGNFYDDKHLGNDGRIGSHKQEFVRYAKERMGM